MGEAYFGFNAIYVQRALAWNSVRSHEKNLVAPPYFKTPELYAVVRTFETIRVRYAYLRVYYQESRKRASLIG